MTAKPQPHNHAGHSCHCHSSDSKETGARNVVLDPVCGMKVDRAAARHLAKQEGRRFYFCSSRCQEKFEAEPTEIHHRSEEHTSELQSLMRLSYAVFCLKQKIINPHYS